ncbi:unnamed protein product [Ixodes hexagonus]
MSSPPTTTRRTVFAAVNLLLLLCLSSVERCCADELAFLARLREAVRTLNSDVSVACRNHTAFYLSQLQSGTPWALQMWDSTGKAESGILTGSLTFLGFHSECLGALPDGGPLVRNASTPEQFSSRYCLSTVSLEKAQKSPPQGLPEYVWQQVLSSGQKPRFGVCVPSTCSSADITNLVGQAVQTFVKGAEAVDSTCSVPREAYSSNEAAMAVTGVILLFVMLAAAGTTYDLMSASKGTWKRPTSSQSVNITMASNEGLVDDGERKRSKLGRILTSFSLRANGSKLLSTGGSQKESIQIFHGLRFFSMSWIILGHSYSFASTWLTYRNANDLKVVPTDILSQGVANGTFTVDTFFFISGVLVVYVTLKLMVASGGKVNWFAFYTHRYWRSTSIYCLLVDITCSCYDKKDGKRNTSINYYFMSNLIIALRRVLSRSRFEHVRCEFSPSASYLFFYSDKLPRWAVVLTFIIFLASVTTTAVLTAINDYPAFPYISAIVPIEKMNDYMRDVYIKPYCRVGPFLVGMLVGYVIHVTQGAIIIKRVYVWLGWALCAFVMLGVLYAMWPANTGQALPSLGWAVLYGALSRTLWAAGLSWIVIASVAGYGGVVTKLLSFGALKPLSRLTYCAYIIHPVIMAVFYGSREEVFDFSPSLLTYFTLGNVTLSYGISFVLSLLFEAPVLALEKALLDRK